MEQAHIPFEVITTILTLDRMTKEFPGEEVPVRKWQLKLVIDWILSLEAKAND